MLFETFRGRNMQEALAQVKAALGADALIESTRHVSNGGQGWLDRSFVEIVAAQTPIQTAADAIAEGRRHRSSRAAAVGTINAVREISALAATGAFPLVRKTRSEGIDRELRVIRTLLEDLSHSKAPKDRASTVLQTSGIEGGLAAVLAKGALRAARSNPGAIRDVLRRRIADRLQIMASPIEMDGRRIITCIGPTGVGKTTTVAKLAARAHLELGRSVAVITLDTFRVGGVEQMRRFVDLIGIPLDVARDRSQFSQAVAQRRADVVLVDTAGVSAADSTGMKRLADCLGASGDRKIDVLLVVQAAIRARDVERLKTLYRDPMPTGLVVTKLDETSQAGGAAHAALEGPLPLAYLCDGPKVPEDIHDASIEALVDAVLPAPT
jgi:flagellar biosynthesis protein FlhF